MSSSGEEELDELLRRQVMRQPWNFQERRLFDIENSREFREKSRLPVDDFIHLLELIRPRVWNIERDATDHWRQDSNFVVFLHFLGTNSFYHLMHSCHSISTSTVGHIIHRVVPVILRFKREFIRWPDQPLSIATKFRDIAGFPCVAGCTDGAHVPVNPPHNDEDAYVNRHHSKSLNVAMVAGPDYIIYFCSSRCPGRWHDSQVIKESTLWTAFE